MNTATDPSRLDITTAHIFADHAVGSNQAKQRILAAAKSGGDAPELNFRDGLWLIAFTNPKIDDLEMSEFEVCFERACSYLTEEELEAIGD